MDKCQCSFWRKPFPCLCCCKQVKSSVANMTQDCSCSFWRKWFCLCNCEQLTEDSGSESDPIIQQSVSKYLLKNVTELHSVSCIKYDDQICSGKSYSPAAFSDGQLVRVDSCKLVMKKCEREVKILSEGLQGQNIIKFIGIYFTPNSSLPILVTEKIEFTLLQHIETSQGRSLQIAKSYQLLYDIFNGLSYLHTAKVIHLNLSTKSVLLTDKMTPKISNFEYAAYLHTPKNSASLSEDDWLLMRSRDDLFAFDFLPPQFLQLLQEKNHCKGSPINESIDFYSFGCVMLKMFTQWPSSPHANEKKLSNPEECQNYWLSLIAKSDAVISSIAKYCLSYPADQIKAKALLEQLKRCNNDNAVLPAKGDSQFANEVEATTLQPKQINRKPVMPDKADKGLKLNNVTTRNRKTDGASSTKEQGMSKSVGLQVEKVTFKSPHSQTKQVKFKNAASQTKENQTTEDMGNRFKVLHSQLVAQNKSLSENCKELEKELMSLRAVVQDKNEELEKYCTKCIEAEEESFAFTNSFSTAGEGSVLHLQTVYRHMQHNVRSAAVRAHKKVFPNIPLQLSDHGMVAYRKANSIVFQAFSDILNDQLFKMQMPYNHVIQPQQDDTLKQCMKLLACFHTSLKHAERDIKQSLLQEYRGLTKDTPSCIPDDVDKYYSMLAKFAWDCVARTIPMVMSTEETKFNKEVHELKDDDDDDEKEKNILYMYPILFTSNKWPREVAVKGKVKY